MFKLVIVFNRCRGPLYTTDTVVCPVCLNPHVYADNSVFDSASLN